MRWCGVSLEAISFRFDRRRLPELERAARRLSGPLTNEDRAGLRVLLQARTDVDGITRDE
jgi:hypothetical protein